MRIAFVTPYLPHPLDAGGKIRSFHLLRGLARTHDVDLFTVHHGEAPRVPAALAEGCASVFSARLESRDGRWRKARQAWRPLMQVIDHFETPEALSEIRGRLASGRYDLLVADELCMTPYVAGLPGRKLAARQKIEHRHYAALSSRRPPGVRRWIEALDLRRLRRFERAAMAQVDAAVCCSDEDAGWLRRLNPALPLAAVANGVDPEHFEPLPESDGPPALAYVGTLDYPPNIDALDFFFRAIHPRLTREVPEVEVRIVGRNPTRDVQNWSRLRGVTVAGPVPDVRPYLAAATALVVPLRVGGGTRIKILECLAAKRPVVSTSIGAEGLGLRHDEHLLVSDEPDAFAREAARLLRDRDLRRRLAEAGRAHVVAHCTWARLGARFADVCARVATTGAV